MSILVRHVLSRLGGLVRQELRPRILASYQTQGDPDASESNQEAVSHSERKERKNARKSSFVVFSQCLRALDSTPPCFPPHDEREEPQDDDRKKHPGESRGIDVFANGIELSLAEMKHQAVSVDL